MGDYINYFIIYTVSLSSALLYTTSYKKGVLSKKYKYFVLFLIAVFTLDFTCSVIYEIKQHYELDNLSNNSLYTLLTFLEFNLLFLFYRRISENGVTKRTIKYVSILFNAGYFISVLYYILESNFWMRYNYHASILGSILVAIVLMMFLRELLISDKILNYKRNVNFWITFGALFYYLASLPGVLLSDPSLFELSKEYEVAREAYFIVQSYAGTFMHACFIFGFYMSRKNFD